MRLGNLHLPILTRDNENQPLLIAVRKARTAKNKGPAMRPRLCTYAGITGFRSHAWLVPTSCLSSCEQAVCASASAPFSFSKPDFHFRCESRCLCYVASPPYEVCSFVWWLASLPNFRLSELLIAASFQSSDQS